MGAPTGRKPGNVMFDDVLMDGPTWPTAPRGSRSSRTRAVATDGHAVTRIGGELLDGRRGCGLVRARGRGSESRDAMGEDG
jgi:hypothetical protein